MSEVFRRVICKFVSSLSVIGSSMKKNVVLLCCILFLQQSVLAFDLIGQAPQYLLNPTLSFQNDKSVNFAHYVPELEVGFIPQGIEKVDSNILISGYQKFGKSNQCRLLIIDDEQFSYQSLVVKRCHHGGGLSLISDELILLSDTRRLFVLRSSDLSVIHEVKLTGKLRGSFAVVRDGQLYLGTYAQNEADALMYQFNLSDVLNQYSLSEKQSIRAISIPLKAQGADFDNNGNLWLTSNAKSHGWLMKMNDDFVVTDKFKLVRGLEDIDVVGDNIWLVSESGAKPYQSWPQLFPAYFRVALSKLSN